MKKAGEKLRWGRYNQMISLPNNPIHFLAATATGHRNFQKIHTIANLIIWLNKRRVISFYGHGANNRCKAFMIAELQVPDTSFKCKGKPRNKKKTTK